VHASSQVRRLPGAASLLNFLRTVMNEFDASSGDPQGKLPTRQPCKPGELQTARPLSDERRGVYDPPPLLSQPSVVVSLVAAGNLVRLDPRLSRELSMVRV